MSNKDKVSKWYFGGIASSGAACCTHPLDLLKVHMQTQKQGKITILGQTVKIVRSQGILALYNGLSASLLRQITYSTTRFGIYEVGKQTLVRRSGNNDITFVQKILLAAFAGACGGFVGTPGDMINVRMQNDIKIEDAAARRNYKHALDGIIKVIKFEGFRSLFNGASTATSRAVFVTIGQLSFYDQIKAILIRSGYFKDNSLTHFTSSFCAGATATLLTMPIDVIKTRQMNSKPNEYKNILDLIVKTSKEGPKAFFKGFIPAFVRLGPHTILTFMFLEQLRLNFGVYP